MKIPDYTITPNQRFLLLLSFIEGAAVMCIELCSARMLAPFFGTSMYVWAAVLAITLLGLAAGYFCGGYLSKKHPALKVLLYVLIAGSTFMGLMPFIASHIFYLLPEETVFFSLVTGTFLLLFFPLLCMGMVSPLIIQLMSSSNENSGYSAGRIYAISTVGGIVATFLLGFYLIPVYGVSLPVYATAFLLAIFTFFIGKKWWKVVPVLWVVLTIKFESQLRVPSNHSGNAFQVLYKNENILGQVLVVNHRYQHGYANILFVNRTVQTRIDFDNRNVESHSPYIDSIVIELSPYSVTHPNVLLVGLGGGIMANALVKNGFNVDACDLDPRMYQIAVNYFQLNPLVKFIEEDGRHFIKTCDKKYDIVIYDVFKAEETPVSLITSESMDELNQVLTKDGIVVLNTNGFTTGKLGKGTRSIAKTIDNKGFRVMVQKTNEIESLSNTILYALKNKNTTMNLPMMEMEDALVLTDHKPILDLLNAKASIQWRLGYIKTYIHELHEAGIPLFW